MKYECHECDWVKETHSMYMDVDDLHEIFAHEKKHKEEKK